MITAVTNDKYHEFRGLQADFDAIKNDPNWAKAHLVGNGSLFVIIPTFAIWTYDEENKVWLSCD